MIESRKRNHRIVAILLTLNSMMAFSQSADATSKAPPREAVPAAEASPPGESKGDSPQASKMSPDLTISSAEIKAFCVKLNAEINKFKWGIDACEGLSWKAGGKSVEGRPLIYAEFGSSQSSNTLLVFSMVHGDEITPLYLGLQLALWLKENPDKLANAHVVIAPLVNPDSFFRKPRTRTNARGVDVNRNFPTRDWEASALKTWKSKFKSNPRRYPGATASSEPETKFQENLIKITRPQKVLSIHAPLNFMDYDGPNHMALDKFPRDYVQESLKLKERLRAIPGGFFPGSLGNYAGQEMGIPTLTLELPTADPRHAQKYWNRFKPGLETMIKFRMPEYASL